jgi:hypothetical protein
MLFCAVSAAYYYEEISGTRVALGLSQQSLSFLRLHVLVTRARTSHTQYVMRQHRNLVRASLHAAMVQTRLADTERRTIHRIPAS